MAWDIPDNLDYRYIAYVPKYTYKYFGIKDDYITGFLDSVWHGISSVASDVWHGVSSIPKEIIYAGYGISKHNNISSAVKQGVTDVSHVLNAGMPVVWHNLPTIPPKQKKQDNDLLSTIGKIGGNIAGQILQYKIMKAAGMLNKTPEQVWNEGMAWTMANRPKLESMYPSPESATAAALWANNGYPPQPNQKPSDIFASVKSGIGKYWWLIVLGIVALIIAER